MKIEKITYHGWENCYRLSYEQIELIAIADIGPRIISLKRKNGENILKEFPETLGSIGGNTWKVYGGHRFWYAPEYPPRTYYPDNIPVQVEYDDKTITLTPPLQDGIQKQLSISIEPDTTVEITHRLVNHTLWDIEIAPWALTVMAENGTAIIPLPALIPHSECVEPTNSLTLWSYTTLADPRWLWYPDRLLVKQDPQLTDPQKIGIRATKGWLGYAHHSGFFVKTFHYQPNATYPDWDASIEVFVDGAMLELETLGPLVQLAPYEMTEHIECWKLYDPISDIDKILMETLP